MASGSGLYPMKRIYSTVAVATGSPEPHSENGYTRDEAEIARFGKKQQLRVRLTSFTPSSLLLLYLIDLQRNFGLISIVGLTCTLMITWEGSLTSAPRPPI